MTLDELKTKYTEAVKTVKAERKMREWVFRGDADKMAKKVAEMDTLLDTLEEMKDALKAHLEPGYEQVSLIDVAQPAKYT